MNPVPYEWISTQRCCVCVPQTELDRQLLGKWTYEDYIIGEVYPEIWQRGYEIPLNIVLDIGCLYLADGGMELKSPAPPLNTNLGKLLDAYCELINGELKDGGLDKVIEEANQAARQVADNRKNNGSPGLPKTKDELIAAGLTSFLEIVAHLLYTIVSGAAANTGAGNSHGFFPGKLNEIRPVINKDKIREALKGNPFKGTKITDPLALSFIESFLATLVAELRNRGTPLGERFETHEDRILAIADIYMENGLQGLDLQVLRECLDYDPLVLDDGRKARYNKLRRKLTPMEHPYKKNPEFGNQGVTTKGSIFSVLRSFLAHKDFLERYYLKQLLFLKRHSPEEVPYKVLLMYVLNRGWNMQTRIPDTTLRHDSLCRILVAYILEDAVRYFKDLAALELHVALIAHDGCEADEVQEIILSDEVLQTAPPADSAVKIHWLPTLKGFRPQYFFREPWELKKNGQMNAYKMKAGDKTGGYPLSYQKAIDKLAKRVRRMAEYYSLKFNLCYVSVFEPSPFPGMEENHQEVRWLKPLTEKLSLNYFRFDKDAVMLKSFTSRYISAMEPNKVEKEKYEKFKSLHIGLTESAVRQKIWENLVDELDLMGGGGRK